MSLVRLLAVGKSLFGIREKPTDFKMREQHRLPVFGSERSATQAKGEQPSGGVRPARLVQAELKLSTVKVVRNDLASADLEVVYPEDKPVSKQVETSEQPAAEPQRKNSSWSDLGARLFEANRNRT